MASELDELRKEYELLLPFKELVELLTDIFDLEYDAQTCTMTFTARELYSIEQNDFINICLIKEDADKFLRALEILEAENDVEQD